MNTKLILSTATLTLLLCFSTFDLQAQNRGQGQGAGFSESREAPRMQRGDRPMRGRQYMQYRQSPRGILSAEVSEALKLSDDQRLRILDLQNEHFTAMQELWDTFRKGHTSPNQMRELREAQRELHQTSLRDVLSESQYAKLEEIRAERRAANRSQRTRRP